MGTFDEIIIQDEKERLFLAYATVEIKDRQKQFVPLSTFKKAFYKFLIRGATLHVVNDEQKHSPLVVGKVISGEEEMIGEYKAFKVLCQIYPHDDDNSIFDDTWNKIKSGTYKGVSIGGGKPIGLVKTDADGTDTMELITVPLMEITVVERPANPLALITAFSMAKSDSTQNLEKSDKVYISSPDKAPKGEKVFHGEKGGHFYIPENEKLSDKKTEYNNEKMQEIKEKEKKPVDENNPFMFGVTETTTIHPNINKSDYMSKPENVDEAKWERSKKIVKEQYKFTEENERFWKLVQSIYQNMSKVEVSEDALISGIKKELEHIDSVNGDLEAIIKIVFDHLGENPNYYSVNLEKSEVKVMEEYEEKTPSETVDLAQTLKALTEHMEKSHGVLMKIYDKMCAEEEMMKKEPEETEEIKEEKQEETKPEEPKPEQEEKKEEIEKSVPSEEGEKKEVTEEIDETSKEANLAKSDVTEIKKEDGKIFISATPSISNLEKSAEEPKTVWEAEVKRKLGRY